MTGERSSMPGGSAPDAIVLALNELLEAERAGARVALASIATAPDETCAALMRTVREDEARWCAMLSGQVRRLGGSPSRTTGAFYGKAMAIADWQERLAFLNRGQAWVVRKLEELTARVGDEALRHDLRAMLDSHLDNIDHAARLLDSGGSQS
jgi:hypothetical protein